MVVDDDDEDVDDDDCDYDHHHYALAIPSIEYGMDREDRAASTREDPHHQLAA